VSLHSGSRVLLKALDGIRGTVVRLPDEDHVTVLADGSGQPVRWRRDEVIELDEEDN
jgi:preprotein translocase subunit YajC